MVMTAPLPERDDVNAPGVPHSVALRGGRDFPRAPLEVPEQSRMWRRYLSWYMSSPDGRDTPKGLPRKVRTPQGKSAG